MTTTFGAMFITGVVTGYLVGSKQLKPFHALFAILFGFFLAASPIASMVNSVAETIGDAIRATG